MSRSAVGLRGLIFPWINTPEQAREAVEAGGSGLGRFLWFVGS